MLDAHLAACELERMHARRSAEFARQLALYAEEIAYRDPPANGDPRTEPDWATDY